MAIDLEKLSTSLYDACNSEPIMFLEWTPQEPDSTTFVDLQISVSISGINGYRTKLNLNRENYIHVMTIVESVFNVRSTVILTYNAKSLCTLHRKLTRRNLVLKRIFDLFWYESYLRLEPSKGNFLNAVRNFKSWMKNKPILDIYIKVYKPLIFDVIPSIESFKFVNDDTGKIVYSNYNIEGQENGRLSCSCDKKNTFNPHSLGEEKKNLKIHDDFVRKYILQYDYRNMEVNVLACLSEDPKLLEIINSSGANVYEKIFEAVTGLKNYDDSRILGKKMFLPLIYGQTYGGLSKALDISVEQSEIYYNNAKKVFSKAFSFVEEAQNSAKADGFLIDFFGRKRFFEQNESYKGRNFIIQSPAALICLEALIKLHKSSQELFSVAFHVHDGYYIVTEMTKLQDSHHIVKSTLESKTDLMPCLQLKVGAQMGLSFDKMVVLNKK